MSIRALALGIVIATLAPAVAVACPGGLTATMLDNIDSSKASLGQPFRFRIVQGGRLLGTAVPAGTIGYGVVRAVDRAGRRAHDGGIALEPRYLVIGRRHVQVAIDPAAPVEWTPRTTLVQKGLGRVPMPLPGLAMSAINTVRYGRNIDIGPGTTFGIVGVPDLARAGVCSAG